MLLTFTNITDELVAATGNTSSAQLVFFKRDANRAIERFKSVMTRPWSRISKKTNIVASQQNYQLPRSVLRPSGVEYKYGDSYYPLQEVSNETTWGRLNAVPSVTIGIPRFYFMKGKDLICLYPTPGTAVTEGLRVYYEPKQPEMVAADVTTGTVTVTQGSATITHSGTSFTESMVGSYFHVTDGSDGYWYQVVQYNSSSSLTIENLYEGLSGSGRTFLIGQVPDIPEEFHDAIIDFCLGRYYKRRKDVSTAADYSADFEIALMKCKEAYSSPTSDVVIEDLLNNRGISIFDFPPGVLS